jgi:hypothetical protein
LASRQDEHALLVDLDLHCVEPVVLVDDIPRQRLVVISDRIQRVGQLLLHHAAHAQHAVAQVLQLAIETLGDVVAEILSLCIHMMFSIDDRYAPGGHVAHGNVVLRHHEPRCLLPAPPLCPVLFRPTVRPRRSC